MIDLARGSIVLFGERGEYTGKPRPGIVVQRASTLTDAPSVTLCGLTTMVIPNNPARIPLSPAPENGLKEPSFVMIDKIASISRSRIREVVGSVSADDLLAVETALRRWLDL